MDARLILVALLFPLACHGIDHQAWDALLKKHVVVLDGGKASRVDYAGMAKDREALKRYLDSLSAATPKEFAAEGPAAQMAFLINAYNAFMVEKILTRYPDVRSVWDFGKLFGNPFKDRFFNLFGNAMSLDDIEHETLRKNYREPRIHYAVNCASIGCPMLREEAYAASRLEQQLEEQAMRFLSDRSRNRWREGRLEVSKIFDWYGRDFEPRDAYFRRYAGALGMPAGAAPALSFLDYDWSLNDSRSSSRR
jgi:hypothetical protein